MISFDEETKRERTLLYNVSAAGSLYIQYDDDNRPIAMVRVLDREIPADWAASYAELVDAVIAWIADRGLDDAIRTQPVRAIGKGLIKRDFHIFLHSIRDWDVSREEGDYDEQLLARLDCVRARVSSIAAEARSPVDILLANIVKRSIVEATCRTYYSEREQRFIIVEPKIDRKSLAEWRRLEGLATVPEHRG